MTLPSVKSLQIVQTKLSQNNMDELCEWIEEMRHSFESNDHSYDWFTRNPDRLPLRHEIRHAVETASAYTADHIWMQCYNYLDVMHIHNHSNEVTDRSGILFLDNIGQTSFLVDKGHDRAPVKHIASSPGKLITFPPNVYHYVMSHNEPNAFRHTIAFNTVRRNGND